MTLRSLKVHTAVIEAELRSSRSVRQVLRPVASRATRAGRQVAGERVQRRTGRYVAGFKSHVEGGRGNAIARVVLENTAPHAPIIEKGSRPHTMPRKATVYVFEADSGVTVFTHGPINHPGTQPQRVIEVALKRVARGGI
jgi:hypothetical protein